MKKLFFLAVSALMMASCAPEEYLGEIQNSSDAPIEFGTKQANMIKGKTAEESASLLGGKFRVYGIKWSDLDKTEQNPNGISEVFHNTLVEFSNGKWHYNEETRYWDPNASKYNFIAYNDQNNPQVVVSPTGTASTTADVTIGNAENPVDIAKLQNIYVAKGVKVEKGAFTSPVKFMFNNAAAKVRVAFYEAIPGYRIIIDNFHTNITTPGASNQNAILHGTFVSTAAYNVILDDAQSEMTSIIESSSTTTDKITLGNNFGTQYIGENIADATFDKSSKEYTWVMPNNNAGGDIQMKIDYRLVSSRETIARTSLVKIPANFNKWYANHAYTYFFKITDNDLHPITFSAEVVDFQNAETVTTIDADQEADITTFVAGSTVQSNQEYKKGDVIYVGVTNATSPTVQVAHSDDEELDGSNAAAKILDSAYGTNLAPIASGTYQGCYSFTASNAGKYVIRVKYTDSKSQEKIAYKVVTVVE